MSGSRIVVREVRFAGLDCSAIERQDLGVAICLPGASLGMLSRDVARDIKFGRKIPTDAIVQKGRLECSTCRMPVEFIADGRVLVFPYVLGAPPHHFVVDRVSLASELEFNGAVDPDAYRLMYRVICPRCRDHAVTVASNVFAEIIERNGGQV